MKLKLFILASLILSSLQLIAQDFSAENNEGKLLYYNILNSTSVELTNATGGTNADGNGTYIGHINIPQTVTYNNTTYNIKGIGKQTFYDCEALDGVYIPDGIEYINDEAFGNCLRLASIHIPESVISIGKFAFLNCDKITTIDLPNSITMIGDKAFYGCKKLQSIRLPQYLTELNTGTFINCIELYNIILPNTLERIGDSAFYKCSNLYTLTIGNHVKTIGNNAFFDCTNLTIVILPNSIKTIQDRAFMNCVNLQSLNLSANLKTIGKEAFQNCMRLSQIKIPNSVTALKSKAFNNCFAVHTINLGTNIDTIESNTFSNCNNINAIYWNAKHVKNYFNDIYNPEIEKHPFYGSSINQIIFTDSVTIIPTYAFTQTPINNIFIGKNVITIKDFAFSQCQKLKTINIIATTPPIINSRAFNKVDTTATLYVPCNVMEQYQIHPYWKRFTNMLCTYQISVKCNNDNWGSTIGDNFYLKNSDATIQAIPQNLYRFSRWNDGNIENPRIINVTQDSTFTAIFELDINNGIEEYTNNNRIIIYPNPTTGMVHIDAENIQSISVYDIIGQFIKQFEYQNIIDISNLAVGQYILKIQTPEGITTQSIILR